MRSAADQLVGTADGSVWIRRRLASTRRRPGVCPPGGSCSRALRCSTILFVDLHESPWLCFLQESHNHTHMLQDVELVSICQPEKPHCCDGRQNSIDGEEQGFGDFWDFWDFWNSITVQASGQCTGLLAKWLNVSASTLLSKSSGEMVKEMSCSDNFAWQQTSGRSTIAILEILEVIFKTFSV